MAALVWVLELHQELSDLKKLFPSCRSGPDKFGTQGPDFAFLVFSALFKTFLQSLRPKMEYIR